MNNAYLDVRCAYVIAKLNLQISTQFSVLFPNANASIDLESREVDEIDLQILEAERLGWCDARAECDDQVPLLFADEPALSWAWKRGVEQHDLEYCSSCRAAGFDLCPFHG